jgi:hypothetical protein
MTNENLAALINRANGFSGPQIVFTRPLAANVYLATAWLAAPSLTNRAASSPHGYDLYLIRSAGGVFVGAVLDMVEDLHWLVSKPFRGHGWLTKALRQVILPHLLQTREQQTITISRDLDAVDRESSEKVARSVGFVLLEENVHERTFAFRAVEPLPKLPEPAVVVSNMTEERLEALQQQLAHHAACLRLIQAEIIWTLADGPVSEELGDVAEELHGCASHLERLWFTKGPQSATL